MLLLVPTRNNSLSEQKAKCLSSTLNLFRLEENILTNLTGQKFSKAL